MPWKARIRCPVPQPVERPLVDSHSLLFCPMRSSSSDRATDANYRRYTLAALRRAERRVVDLKMPQPDRTERGADRPTLTPLTPAPPRAGLFFSCLNDEATLMNITPSPIVLVEGTRDHSHGSGMLTSEDLRELAQRCLRLAKTSTNPNVAEQLLMLAANYLELAQRALGLHQPPRLLT